MKTVFFAGENDFNGPLGSTSASMYTVHNRFFLQSPAVQMKPVKFALPRCTSTELFFFCCGSVAALPALANCNEHVTKKKS